MMGAMEQRPRRRPAGWPGGWHLVSGAAVVVALLSLGVLHYEGTGEHGLRHLIRATARLSAVLLSLVLIARPLRQLWPTRTSAWLLANRRYLGVSFAVSHLAHGLAILALSGGSFAGVVRASGWLTTIFGGLGFLFIAAMTATSLDRTAAWLGRRRWRILHTTGVYYLAFIFLQSYLPRALRSPAHLPLLLLLVGALLLRVAAWTRRRRPA